METAEERVVAADPFLVDRYGLALASLRTMQIILTCMAFFILHFLILGGLEVATAKNR